MSTKQGVLAILEKNKGKLVSGSVIASELGLTRSAVGKAITSLRNKGYNINASTRNGYSLNKDTDLLSREGIFPYLSEQNQGLNIFTYDSVDSTNNVAKKLAIDGAEHGTVVVARHQSAGKGRLGRKFYSPANTGVYMSMVLRPKITIENATMITTATSVAVCHAITKLVPDTKLQIKWVNDVFIENKKICGISTEAITSFENGAIDSIILGIGINVGTSISAFPEELQDIVTSLSENQAECDKNKLIAEVINEVLEQVNTLESRAFLEEYRELSYVLSKPIYVITPTDKYKAVAVDIDQNGGLIVKDMNNKFITLNSGEVSVRRIENE